MNAAFNHTLEAVNAQSITSEFERFAYTFGEVIGNGHRWWFELCGDG